MYPARLNKKPTAYDELSFVENIYKTDAELIARMSETGFKKYRDIEVPNVDCFIYVPAAFPILDRQVMGFNFSAHREKRMTVGVCIGGTTMLDGWGEKLKLGVQGLLKKAHNNDKAELTASQILQALEDFGQEYPELSRFRIKLDVCVCGYSLGGLFAQVTTLALQDWAAWSGNKVTCRTYDGPGVPQLYHDTALNYGSVRGWYWNQTITNYKSFPSPLNTVFDDIGRVFHLKNNEQFETDLTWTINCFASTTFHLASWSKEMSAEAASKKKESSSKLEDEEEDEQEKHRQENIEKMHDIASCLAGAAKIGLNINEIVRNHSVTTMMGCFDRETGQTLIDSCTEMRKWPKFESFVMLLVEDACSLGRQLTNVSPGQRIENLFDLDQPGLFSLFFSGGKRGYLERTLEKLSGYCPM